MKKLRYILAASIAVLSLSTSAYAVGNAVDDLGNGIGDAIDGAGNAIGDIMGGREGADDPTDDPAADTTTADDTAADTTTAEVTTAEETTAEETTPEVTTDDDVAVATTTAPTVVEGTNNKNPGTGVAAGFTAIGAVVAGLTAMAAKKRR